MGIADASKNNRKVKILVQLKAPIKQISKIKTKFNNNWVLTAEYQAVKRAIIKIAILRIMKGKFKLWYSSNPALAG